MVKRFVFLVSAVLTLSAFAFSAPGDRVARREIAKKLYGRIKVVNNSEDYRVKVIHYNIEDLRVVVVDKFADAPGKWMFVNDSEDFKIKFVNHSEDIGIRFVQNLPGVSGE